MKSMMPMMMSLVILTLATANDDESKEEQGGSKLNSATLSGLKLRNIGPALMSGRISDIAIDPKRPNTWYVAAGSGNLWKTTNAGTTWKPIFDDYGAYSIGCVTIDPSDRNTIWVGTGEDVGGRHVGVGDGVYRSLDGGKRFKKMGLEKTEHIAKVLVHPRNSRIIYVAAQGPLWSPGGERGLYKSTDGGETWDRILAKGEYTGVTDVEFDPRDPQIVFAVTHQRHRTVATLVNGGPESGIFKSTDAGQTWRKLTSGLPGEDKGKISIAISPMKPDIMYATIELAGRTGGFWRSTDRGETWSKMDDYAAGGTGPHYYQEIWCDPHRLDVVYQANVRLGRTEDGGSTWEAVASPHKHVDNHAVRFHPSDPDFLLVGCDGGLYRSVDFGKTYAFFANLPLTQFYKVDVDDSVPFYHVVGGTQDNSTQLGPSRTNNRSGIRNSDWRAIIGGDGHDCEFDSGNSNIIYCESQEGFLRRFDRGTGQSVDIQPRSEDVDEILRFNWDSPIHISPHSTTRIYHAANKLFRSDDRGDSWTAISPDLTRNLNRFTLKVMDRVWSVDALYDNYAMSQFCTITSISESPLVEDLIYVGTDDGLVQVTENGGADWRKIDQIYGIPEFSFVNDVKTDLHDADTVYVALDNHKAGDFRPYLVKSTNRGRTWESMVGDLPDRHLVWRLVQDHVNKDLFFLGTELGIFVTLDAGQHWIKMTGGVPTISFRDLEIQRRENDLVAASFGRSFFILDDYSPLRQLSEASLTDNELILFPVRKALQFIPARFLGGQKGTQGDGFFTAENPPNGAVFTVYMRDTLKTNKATRREQEAKLKKEGKDTSIPEWDELTKEEREEPPRLELTVRDSSGNVVNRIKAPATAGFHRVSWNLRYAPFSAGGGEGPLAAPGSYTVQVTKRVKGETTELGEPQTFEVVALGEPSVPVPDRQDVLAFQRKVGELSRAARGAKGRTGEALEQIAAMKKAVRQSTADNATALYDAARSLELKLLDAQQVMVGTDSNARRGDAQPIPILRRIGGASSGAHSNIYGPTQTHRRQFEIAKKQYAEFSVMLRTLIETDLADLRKEFDKAEVPWTAGRDIPTVGGG